MPYFKRFGKRTMRRKPYSKAKYAKRLASRATLTNIVNTVVSRNAELKFWDDNYTGGSAISVVFPGSITDIFTPAIGTSDSQRVGDRVKLNHLSLRGFLYCPLQAGNSINFMAQYAVRVVLVQWYPSSVPVVSDIIQAPGTTNSPFKWDTRQMFRVLSDKHYCVVSAGSKSNVNIRASVKLSKLKTNKVQFQASSTTGTNKIYLILDSNGGVPGNSPYADFYTRISYTDS